MSRIQFADIIIRNSINSLAPVRSLRKHNNKMHCVTTTTSSEFNTQLALLFWSWFNFIVSCFRLITTSKNKGK